jgi:uncharacterized protein
MSIGTRATLCAASLALAFTAGCYPRPKAVVWLANEATAYCAAIGGQPDSRADSKGRQFGFCRLQDDRICEMWTLWRRGKCVEPRGGKGWDLFPY